MADTETFCIKHLKISRTNITAMDNRGGSLSFLVGTIGNVLVMEIGWTDVGSGGYILVSIAHSNTRLSYDIG
jgi:hypothetical protein